MVNELVSAVIQILVFVLIPFLYYLIKHKKATGFLEYIGLKKSPKEANYLAIYVFLIIAIPVLLLSVFNSEFYSIMTSPGSMTGKFKEMGLSIESVSILIVAAVFKTSFAEEILFRGFIAKRLIAITSFQTGNIIHALLFGAIHTALFLSISSNPWFLFVIFLFPTVGAYFMVWINEKKADGSIVPGWIAHALSNLASYAVVGFLI